MSSAPIPAPRIAPRFVALATTWSQRTSLRIGGALLPLAAGGVLWASSLQRTEIDSLGEYGLPPALPATWYVALAVLVTGAVTAIWAPQKPRGWIIAAYVMAVGVVLFATVPAIADVPHYPWTYKHIAVSRLIDVYGSTSPDVDIYNRWPGFFALAGAFSRLAGLPNPVSYAAWAEPLFALACALFVAAIARVVTRDVRIAGCAALVFLLGNWVGQTYFAPQALAWLLALTLLLVVLRQLSTTGDVARRTTAVLARVMRRAQEPVATVGRPAWDRRVSVVLVIVLDAAIVATHQLTPYVLVLQVAALATLGSIRPRWLPIAMATLTIAYLVPHFDYVEERYGLLTGLNPLDNAERPLTEGGTSPPGKQLNALAGQLLSVTLLSLTLVATLRLGRRGLARRALPLLVLAAMPFAVLFGQSYGGEAGLRGILMSSAGCAVLIAWAIGTLPRAGARFAASLSICTLMAGLLVPAFYGQEELNVVPEGEVRAAEYFDANAPAGSALVTAGANFPGRVGPRYGLMVGDNLLRGARFRGRPLGDDDIPDLIGRIHKRSRNGYVVFSTSSQTHTDLYGLAPPGALDNLERAVATSPRFRLWHTTEDARIYQLVEPR